MARAAPRRRCVRQRRAPTATTRPAPSLARSGTEQLLRGSASCPHFGRFRSGAGTEERDGKQPANSGRQAAHPTLYFLSLRFTESIVFHRGVAQKRNGKLVGP